MSKGEVSARMVREFFELAQERYRIRLARLEGRPAPWTRDPVLSQFRFCNVHREHDKTTVWFRENIREPLNSRRNPVKLILATIAFRWFNRIETGELIRDVLLTDGWNPYAVRYRLTDVSPIVTGAYMIKTPAEMTKLEGIIKCMNVAAHMPEVANIGDTTLEVAHKALERIPYMGGFMAYEVVSDLRWTCLLEDASDILTWCHLGPGATRGLQWITGREYNRNSPQDQAEMLRTCDFLRYASEQSALWPADWPRWEMREVEHWLCEYDKWKRGCAGQSLKRRFTCA